jgi:hypothetical protein
MPLFVAIGPYAVLPDVSISTTKGTQMVCPACADSAKRQGAFCNTCGTALVAEPVVVHRPLNQWDIPNDDERFFVLEDHPRVLLYNFKSPHVLKVDGDDRGRTIDMPPFTAEQSLAWFQEEAKPVSDWLASAGHPPLTFRYGVVVGSF